MRVRAGGLGKRERERKRDRMAVVGQVAGDSEKRKFVPPWTRAEAHPYSLLRLQQSLLLLVSLVLPKCICG